MNIFDIISIILYALVIGGIFWYFDKCIKKRERLTKDLEDNFKKKIEEDMDNNVY